MTTTDMEQPDTAASAGRGGPASSGLRRLLPATPLQHIVAVTALMFFAASLGYFIGAHDGGAPAADSADVGFLYDMSAHHEQAVQLSMIQLVNGSDSTAQAFAREILRSQSYEIGLMQMRLGVWGFAPAERQQPPMAWMGMAVPDTDAMPGMADAAELEAFRNARGADADALFFALMSDHHAGGAAMAQDAANRADDDWVVDTAERMARIQAQEIAEMQFAREAAGLPAAPVGFAADFDADAEPMGDVNMDSPDPHSDMDMGDGG